MSVSLRKPSITANTPQEQIAQLRSYLYQLTNELEYALEHYGSQSADTAKSNSDIESIAAAVRSALHLGNEIISDYICEQSVSDIWTWRKWSSGIAECFASANIESGIWSGEVTPYFAAPNAILLPDMFLTDSPLHITATIGAVGNVPITLSGVTVSTVETDVEDETITRLQAAFTFIRFAGDSSSMNIPVYIHAVGKWK